MKESAPELLHSSTKICHRLTASIAKGIAAEAWEILSHEDVFHRKWPNVRHFVRLNWKQFIGHARAAMGVMLTPIPGTERDPDGAKYKHSLHMRDEVFEAMLIEGEMKSRPNRATRRANASGESLH